MGNLLKKTMKFVLMALVGTISANFLNLEAEPTTPCCGECTGPQEKYYSIVTSKNHCGECCMKPSQFWIFKIFEPNLAKDDSSDTPCADRKYTEYLSTPTHGVYPVSMTLDLYSSTPANETEVAVAEV